MLRVWFVRVIELPEYFSSSSKEPVVAEERVNDDLEATKTLAKDRARRMIDRDSVLNYFPLDRGAILKRSSLHI